MWGRALAGVLLTMAVGAQAASATTMTIPAGGKALISNTILGGCDANAYGYEVGSTLVPVASKANDCPTGSSINEPDVLVGPVSTSQVFRLYLQDGTCNQIYYSDGTPYNHALVTGTNPYTIRINDGGPGCPNVTSPSVPASNGGNFIATVTIYSPPTVTLTAPAPPANQGGYFNAANLGGGGGHISVGVSAQDNNGTGGIVTGISCTDNNAAVTVTNPAGQNTATMTGTVVVSADGTHSIVCLATSNRSGTGTVGTANTATVKIDATAPTLTVPTTPAVVAANSLSGAAISSYPTSATDAESGVSTIACTPAAPVTLPVGNTSVTCTAIDTAGNASAPRTFTVTVTPLPPPTASFGLISTSGPVATVVVVCSGASGQACTGTLTATSHWSSRKGSVIATAAAASPTTVTNVVVGQASYSVAAGGTTKVTLKLSSAAAKVLGKLYSLKATLALTGGVTHTVTFQYTRINATVLYAATFHPHATTLSAFTASPIPAGSTVVLKCGGGCSHTYKPKKSKLDMSKAVANRVFKPGAKITVTITAKNRIGQVSVITIRASAQPKYAKLCLSPGASRPAPCHS